jgi:hypothetical protein
MRLGDLGRLGEADFAERHEEMERELRATARLCFGDVLWRQGHARENRTRVARGSGGYCYCGPAAMVWLQIPPHAYGRALSWKERGRLCESEDKTCFMFSSEQRLLFYLVCTSSDSCRIHCTKNSTKGII